MKEEGRIKKRKSPAFAGQAASRMEALGERRTRRASTHAVARKIRADPI